MSESGIAGINYTAQPQRIDMEKNSTVNSQIALQVENDQNNTSTIRPGQYTIMVRLLTSYQNTIDKPIHLSSIGESRMYKHKFNIDRVWYTVKFAIEK